MKYKFKDGDCTVKISIEVPGQIEGELPPIEKLVGFIARDDIPETPPLDVWWAGFTDVMICDRTSDDFDNPFIPRHMQSSDLYKLGAQAAKREHSSYLRYKLGAQAAESLKAKRIPVA